MSKKLTYNQARQIVEDRIDQMDGVTVDENAIERAIANLMGEDYEAPPEPEAPAPKPSPMVTDSRGLHEKYFQDG